MRIVFLDTQCLVARVNPRDQWHAQAQEVLISLGGADFVTTESVLIEMLNFFAAYHTDMKRTAAEFVRDALDTDEIEVVPHTRESFLSGLRLYGSRLDKGYSLTDCISMATMRERQIRDVLTHDDHFRQEGFNVLL